MKNKRWVCGPHYKKSLQNQLWKDKWKPCQVSYYAFLSMVFCWGLSHGFWMLGENRRRSRKRESEDTSNKRSSSSSLVSRLQTNLITVSPAHSLRFNNLHTTTSLCSSKCLIKHRLCHKNCKGLENIYTASCAESSGIKLPKVKQHNRLPFLPPSVENCTEKRSIVFTHLSVWINIFYKL